MWQRRSAPRPCCFRAAGGAEAEGGSGVRFSLAVVGFDGFER